MFHTLPAILSPFCRHFLDVFVEVSKPGKTLSESSKTFGVFCANPLVFFFFLTPAECFVGLAENDKLCFFFFLLFPLPVTAENDSEKPRCPSPFC